MELIQADPLPEVCLGCHEPDCFSCDYGGLRWRISDDDLKRIREKMLQRQKERLQRKGHEKTPSKPCSEGDIFRELKPACSASGSCCSSCGQRCSCAEDP